MILKPHPTRQPTRGTSGISRSMGMNLPAYDRTFEIAPAIKKMCTCCRQPKSVSGGTNRKRKFRCRDCGPSKIAA